MRAIVTCGPSYEPIDAVRRITNFSTGELGILLTNALHRAGIDVICMKGAGATSAVPVEGGIVTTFTTNDHLRSKLERTSAAAPVDAVFHAAALSDYRVARVSHPDGTEMRGEKLCSRDGILTLTLAPTAKILNELRTIFPRAHLVGWKYELDGSRDLVIEKGRRQISDANTDLCVLNGKAYGPGFGMLDRKGGLIHCETKDRLCMRLVEICTARVAPV